MEVEGTQTQRQTKNNKIKGFEAFQFEVRIDWNILQLDLFTYMTHLTTLLNPHSHCAVSSVVILKFSSQKLIQYSPSPPPFYPPPHSDISLSLTFRTQTFGRGASGMMAVLGQKMEFLGENFQFKFWFIFSEIAKLKTIHCYCLSICFFSLKNLKTKIHLKYKSGPQSSIKFWGRIKIVNIFWNSPSQCPTPPSCLLSPRARDFCILRVEITK